MQSEVVFFITSCMGSGLITDSERAVGVLFENQKHSIWTIGKEKLELGQSPHPHAQESYAYFHFHIHLVKASFVDRLASSYL